MMKVYQVKYSFCNAPTDCGVEFHRSPLFSKKSDAEAYMAASKSWNVNDKAPDAVSNHFIKDEILEIEVLDSYEPVNNPNNIFLK